MEILLVITIGIIATLVILALMVFEKRVTDAIWEYNDLMVTSFITILRAEHKKTRKETQEIKTRLTQNRKDLNDIQKTLKKK